MVALSHATARELGYAPPPDSEDAKRPFVEVSGRKGLGVKADDLLDTLIEKAGGEVAKRNPELSDRRRRAHRRSMIAIAAVRYFLIKFSRGKVIAFDLDEALSFEGESGPYIQYAVVRANNIFQKLQQRDGLDEARCWRRWRDVPAGELTGDNGNHELWSLVLEAARLDEVVEQVIRTLEFSVLAKYAFALAQAFNAFYHPLADPERGARRRAALARGGGHLPAQPADAGARPDGRRRSGADVARMPVIAIAPCSKLHDYEEAVAPRRRRGRCVSTRTRAPPADVIAPASTGMLLTGGGDVLPSLYGEAAHPDVRRRGDRTRRLRARAGAPRARRRPAALRHLPRHPGAERRAAAARSCRTFPIKSARLVESRHCASRRTRSRTTSGSPSGSLLESLMRERLEGDTCPVNSRHHQAPRRARQRTRGHRDRARRRHRSDRGSRRSASASACSGTRRTSVGPASSGRCSKGSSKAAQRDHAVTPADRLRELLRRPGILVMPGCHDAMSARLIEEAGFEIGFMSGFAVSASRLGMPDTGLISYGEMVDQGRNICRAVSIPMIGDGDTGFGSAQNIKRTGARLRERRVRLHHARGSGRAEALRPHRRQVGRRA